MTAARSDLMALAAKLRMWPAADGADGRSSSYIESLMQEAADAFDRLAASQPDSAAIKDALINARSSLKAFGGDPRPQIARYGEGDEIQAAVLNGIDEALSLLSGAGTKSDGGKQALVGPSYGSKFTYPRPSKRDDGVSTRIDLQHFSPAELAIFEAVAVVEATGGSPALTDAVNLLAKARDRVADHVEGIETPSGPGPDVREALEEAIATFESDPRTLFPDSEVLLALDKIAAALTRPSGGGK